MDKQEKKPELRFQGYVEDWEQRKLSDIVDVLDGDRGKNYPTDRDFNNNGHTLFLNASNVTTDGFLFEDTQYISEEKSNSMGNGKLQSDDIVVTSRGSLGHVAWYNADIMGIIPYARINSGMLILRKKIDIQTSYLYQFMKSHKGQEQISFMSFGSAQPQLTKKGVENLKVVIPKEVAEQKQIADCFCNLDNLITLHQCKYDKLLLVKKSMLEKMFPREGSSVPEIRFFGFNDDWEQRKFSELVTIERGGSPRPIDKFITKDENGLNWVKIGDAPEQGNYITQTAEKIKPEGLSKTREVHPGDLILSNSMSFGRPYIMAINGCIHDGWLAIRDTQKNFDLKFLCILLGTDNMLSQYKAMAAGSTVNNLNKELVGGTTVSYPAMDEQIKLGEYFESLDNLITLHQRKIEKLKLIKEAMLEKMFI